MSSAPERAPITEWLVVKLGTVDNALAGKIIAPKTAGWQKDSTQVGSTFVPYFVITPGTGTPVNPSIEDLGQDWNLPYQVTTYGVDPNQVEDLADSGRKLLVATTKVVIAMSDGNWKITFIRCPSIGGVGYTTAVDPTAYSQTDSFILNLSRSLT